MASAGGRLSRLVDRARTPVDASSLAVVRIAFGLIALWEVKRYFAHGWIQRYWEDPQFHFHYVGFGWVHPLPPPGMDILWMVLGVAALGIALGAFYRVSAIVFAVGFGYSFFLEATRYLNHFYFIEMLAIVLAIVPAHRVWSVDAWAHRRPGGQPIPAWALWLVRFQIGVIYVGGGVAKIEPDWLRGQPMSMWLGDSAWFPVIGGLFDSPHAGLIAAWLGMFFDLFIVFAVAWRPTRPFALLAALVFHATNAQLFSIGVFPYLAMAGLTVFCEPDWPRAAAHSLRSRAYRSPMFDDPEPLSGRGSRLATVGVAVALLYVAAQVLIPLRHVVMPGRAAWTEAGHTFAWHMKLRSKSGEVTFFVTRPGTLSRQQIDPRHELAHWQYEEMAGRPELIRQYAHHLADLLQEAQPELPRPHVYASAMVSLNGRLPQPMIDENVDLAAEPATLGTPSWVLPLRLPLPPRDQVHNP